MNCNSYIEYTLPIDLTKRNAANFVYKITPLPFDIKIIKDSTIVNAKSMIGVLSLCLQKNEKIEFCFECRNGKYSDIEMFEMVRNVIEGL